MVHSAVGVSMCVLNDVSRFGLMRLLNALLVNCKSNILHESRGTLFCTACNIVVEHKRKSSIDKHFATMKHNYRTAGRTSDDGADHYDTGCCIQLNCQRRKNQESIIHRPILSVFALLIHVFFQ